MSRTYLFAAVAVFGLFLAFASVLIVTNHAEDLRAFLIICAQGIGFLLNFWLIHRNSTAQKEDISRVARKVDNVKDTVEHVSDVVNGSGKP